MRGLDRARADSCSDYNNDLQAGPFGRWQPSGHPTAEAVEQSPCHVVQRKCQSFDSSKAQRGSMELVELTSLECGDFKQHHPPTAYISTADGSQPDRTIKDSASELAATAGDLSAAACKMPQALSAGGHGHCTAPAAFSALAGSGEGRKGVTPGLLKILKAKPRDAKVVSQFAIDSHMSLGIPAVHPDTVSAHHATPPTSLQTLPEPIPLTASALPNPSTRFTEFEVQPLPATAASTHNVLWPYVQQHGRSIMSISALQSGLQHFVLPGIGCIAYSMMNNGPDLLNILTPVALGDPLCDPGNYPLMAAAFLKKHPKAMFLQITKPFAFVLRGMGMLINSVGGETELDLQKYTFSGYAKRGLRSAIASAVKDGITVQEVMQAPMGTQQSQVAAAAAAPQTATNNKDITQAAAGFKEPAAAAAAAATGDWSSLASEMMEVGNKWLKNKGNHAGRVWFLNRPPVFAPEPGVRKFIARDRDGRMAAFIFFDAVYEGGHIMAYYANVTRMRPDAHPGTLNLIIRDFIDKVRAESQLAAPAKKLSIKKSKLKKQQQQQQQQQSPTASAQPAAAAAGTAATPLEASAAGNTSSSSSRGHTGPKFLSLGLSPLYQMIDGNPFSHSKFIHCLFEFSFRNGGGYYPFESLASAKAKYGAGLRNGVYEDPNVTYKQVYLAHTHRLTACATMFDLGKMLGFWSSPGDAALAFSGHKLQAGANLVKKKLAKIRKAKSSDSSSGRFGGGSNSGGGSSSASSKGSGRGCSPAAKAGKCSSSSIVVDGSIDDGASVDSGDENWRSHCFLFKISRRKQYDLHTVPGHSATAAAAGEYGAPTGSSSSGAGKSKVFASGKVLLPLVHPVAPQFPSTAATAAAGSNSRHSSQTAAVAAPAADAASPHTDITPADGASSSSSEYIGTAQDPTVASSSLNSSMGDSTGSLSSYPVAVALQGCATSASCNREISPAGSSSSSSA